MEFHVVVVNYNNERFVRSLHDSLKKHTSQPFFYNICDNGSTEESKKSLRKLQSKDPGVRLLYRQQTSELPHSRHHAAAVDYAISELPKDSYVLVIDVDCYMFKKDWPEFFVGLLGDGAECASSVRSFSKDDGSVFIRAIPYVCFFAVETFRHRNLTFLPDIEKTLSGNKLYDFGYRLNDLTKIESIDIVTPAPSLKGMPKRLIEKSMDFTHGGETIAQHLKAGGRGHKEQFYDDWLEQCKKADANF